MEAYAKFYPDPHDPRNPAPPLPRPSPAHYIGHGAEGVVFSVPHPITDIHGTQNHAVVKVLNDKTVDPPTSEIPWAGILSWPFKFSCLLNCVPTTTQAVGNILKGNL